MTLAIRADYSGLWPGGHEVARMPRAVLIAICSFYDEAIVPVYPSLPLLSRMVNAVPRSVIRSVDQLEVAELMTVVTGKRRGQANEYLVNLPKLASLPSLVRRSDIYTSTDAGSDMYAATSDMYGGEGVTPRHPKGLVVVKGNEGRAGLRPWLKDETTSMPDLFATKRA